MASQNELTPEAWAESLNLQERLSAAITTAYFESKGGNSSAAFASLVKTLSGYIEGNMPQSSNEEEERSVRLLERTLVLKAEIERLKAAMGTAVLP